MRIKKHFYKVFFFLSAFCFSNPFSIDVTSKENLEEADYVELQAKLRSLDTSLIIDNLYPSKLPFTWFWQKPFLQKKSDFEGRISRGVRQTLIDIASEKKPLKKLLKINNGGDHCIVSFASYDGIYPDLLDSIPEALTKCGFNGYFLLLKGGFPNPTGNEIKYSAVPYSFKIFALLEAKKFGFHKVLWLDTALLPLKDPSPIFEQIERNGCFFHARKNANRYLLPQTHNILLEKTGVDMYETTCIRARVIGLDLNLPKVQTLIEEYYHMVELGSPFLSCFPEEFVLGALIAKKKENWPFGPFEDLVINARKLKEKDLTLSKQEGFFLLREH